MTQTNYPVGDFLIRVKNTALAGNKELVLPTTKFIEEVAKTLKKLGFLDEVKTEKGELKVRLAFRNKRPVILGLNLVSKPGLRVYLGIKELEKKKGPKILILSTPEGVIYLSEALKRRVGGEVIAEVW